jgi:DNA helicase II / ATP-dependent DNA helicase PcrA
MGVYRVESASLLEGLHPAQQEAVQTLEGPLLVLAGAGSGKTRVITRRMAYLLSQGVPPESLLAVTFTRKAAIEMRERVSKLLGRTPRGLTVCTFHALGYRLIREQGCRLKFGPRVSVLEERERCRLVGSLLGELDLRRPPGIETVLSRIARAKNDGISPEAYLDEATTRREKAIGGIYARYQEALLERNAIDLDDMVLMPLKLLEAHERVRRAYERRWHFILIDEYQDTSAGQYRLATLLAGERKNICAVGDDDQSIYRFRGADVERILRFEEDFPGARVIRLEVNYRSSAEIVRLGSAVIEQAEKRYEKRLAPALGSSGPVIWSRVAGEAEEARLIAGEVGALHAGSGIGFRDMAVLVRVERHGSGVIKALRRERIPAQRGQGSGEDGGVSVMTIHQSKGLEFLVVFLIAVEDETLPHYHAIREGREAVEEERRLLYVAITRAKARLFLSSCESRDRHERRPSRFLSEINGKGFLVRR